MKIKKFNEINESKTKDHKDEKVFTKQEIYDTIEKEVKKVLPKGWDYEIELFLNNKKVI